MASNGKLSEGRSGNDDYDPCGYPEVFHMTVRHGADYTKRYLDSLSQVEVCGEPDAEA